jgi:hypothetical protein
VCCLTELDWSHIDAYVLAWAAIDTTGSGVMKSDDQLRELLKNMPEPFFRDEIGDEELQTIAGKHMRTTARHRMCRWLDSFCILLLTR